MNWNERYVEDFAKAPVKNILKQVLAFPTGIALALGIIFAYNGSTTGIWNWDKQVELRQYRQTLETKLFHEPALANTNRNLAIEPGEEMDAYRRMGLTNTSQKPTISQLETAVKSYEAER